jgi:hypothetical protein
MILTKRLIRISKYKGKEIYEKLLQCDECKKEKWISKYSNARFCSRRCAFLFKIRTRGQWNKGLSMKTNESLRKMSESLRSSKKFHDAFNTSEYKEKRSKLSSGKNNGFYGKKHSRKTRKLMSSTKSKNIASGKTIIRQSRGIKGWYFSTKQKEKFFFDSFWEAIMMKILDKDNNVITWTKRHKIKIPYKKNKEIKNFVPDFLATYKNKKVIIETKGYDPYKKAKIKVLKKYCKDNNFHLLWIEELELEILCQKYMNASIKQLRTQYKKEKKII